MSLNRGIVNPLNVLGIRKLPFIPNHFAKLTIKHKLDIKPVETWIEYHLNSRYSIQTVYRLDEKRKLTTVIEIGIEDPKEITLLSLGCINLYKEKKEF